MEAGNKVTKAEWLCSALIDLLVLMLISKVFNILSIIFFSNNSDGKDTLLQYYTYFTITVSFLYFLTKDLFFNKRSLGNRTVGISVRKDGKQIPVVLSLLRNLPLALFYCRLFLPTMGINNLFTANLFVFYTIFELLVVNYTGRTIGDLIVGSNMVKDEQSQVVLSVKYDNRTIYILSSMIIFFFVLGNFKPCFYISPDVSQISSDIDYIKKYQIAQVLNTFCTYLTFFVGQGFFIHKLCKAKKFSNVVIVLFALVFIIWGGKYIEILGDVNIFSNLFKKLLLFIL